MFTRLLGVNADEVKMLPQGQKQMVQIQLHLTTERKNKISIRFRNVDDDNDPQKPLLLPYELTKI